MTTIQAERSTGGTIEVVGNTWQPGVGLCVTTYNLRPYDVGNIRGRTLGTVGNGYNEKSITREEVEHWLGANAGDFQNVIDFRAVIDDGPLPACDSCGHAKRREIVFDWADEENECAFLDAMFGTLEPLGTEEDN